MVERPHRQDESEISKGSPTGRDTEMGIYQMVVVSDAEKGKDESPHDSGKGKEAGEHGVLAS